jgi:hypothetical protein
MMGYARTRCFRGAYLHRVGATSGDVRWTRSAPRSGFDRSRGQPKHRTVKPDTSGLLPRQTISAIAVAPLPPPPAIRTVGVAE